MKQLLILLWFCLFFMQTAFCQEEKLPKYNIYKITVNPGAPTSLKGFLGTITDSAVYLSSYPVLPQFGQTSVDGMQKFDYRSLQQIRMQRKAAVGRGVLVGAIVGLVVGVVAALVTYQTPTQNNQYGSLFEPSQGEVLLGMGILGATLGVGTGAIIGAVSGKNFYIDGEWKNLAEMKEYIQNKQRISDHHSY